MAERTVSFFDAEFRLRKIDRIGDPLQKLNELIDWKFFRYYWTKDFQRILQQKGLVGDRPSTMCSGSKS